MCNTRDVRARPFMRAPGAQGRRRWAVRAAWAVGMASALGGVAMAHAAGLIADGQAVRVIPFTVRDGKPMVDASVAGRKGVLMLDNGTPDALFLNRDALPLGKGKAVGRGAAASGQSIDVVSHAAPAVAIGGRALALNGPVRSGNFGFTKSGLGADFLGFIGTPMVERQAFVLDYARRRLTLLRVDPDGALPLPGPQATEVMAELRFLIWPGEQPMVAATLGGLPILTDFDTGDGGTLYLVPATRERLLAAGVLRAEGERWRLSGLVLGGVRFDDTLVNLVEAGGAQDLHRRRVGQPDQLRLGAAFLAQYPSLWNFPARSLSFFKPGAPFLGTLDGPTAPHR